MVLGLIHHLVVTERVPVVLIVELLFDLQCPFVLVEWVNANDGRFQALAGPNAALYDGLAAETFEQTLLRRFEIVDRLTLNMKTRTLYLCRRR